MCVSAPARCALPRYDALSRASLRGRTLTRLRASQAPTESGGGRQHRPQRSRALENRIAPRSRFVAREAVIPKTLHKFACAGIGPTCPPLGDGHIHLCYVARFPSLVVCYMLFLYGYVIAILHVYPHSGLHRVHEPVFTLIFRQRKITRHLVFTCLFNSALDSVTSAS